MRASGGQHAAHVGGLRRVHQSRPTVAVDLGGRLGLRSASVVGTNARPTAHGQSARGLGNECTRRPGGKSAGGLGSEASLQVAGQPTGNLGSKAGLRSARKTAGNGSGGGQGTTSRLGRGRHRLVPRINGNWTNA
jgi:hypothetical protein